MYQASASHHGSNIPAVFNVLDSNPNDRDVSSGSRNHQQLAVQVANSSSISIDCPRQINPSSRSTRILTNRIPDFSEYVHTRSHQSSAATTGNQLPTNHQRTPRMFDKRRYLLHICIFSICMMFLLTSLVLTMLSIRDNNLAQQQQQMSTFRKQHQLEAARRRELAAHKKPAVIVGIQSQTIREIVEALSAPMSCPTSQEISEARKQNVHVPQRIRKLRRLQPLMMKSRSPSQQVEMPIKQIKSHRRLLAIEQTQHIEVDHRVKVQQHFDSSTHFNVSLEPEMDCSATAVDQDLAQLLQPGAAPGVDVVYTYVDGTDPEWRQSIEAASKLHDTSLDDFENRYREWGELKYSMRTISRFAPFVRNIYIVISSPSQVPSWLNQTHNRIRIVYHHELFDDPKSQLPTFNSLAIESVLHRIRGLSRHFLYMNNDVFVNSDVSLSDFITRQSYHQFQDWAMLPFFFSTDSCFKLDFEFEAPPTESDLSDYFKRFDERINDFVKLAEELGCFNTVKRWFFLDRFIIYKLYGIQRRFWAAHVPHLWERCAMYEFERSPLAPFLHRVRRNRFRDPRRDISTHLQYEALLLSRWNKVRFTKGHSHRDADAAVESTWDRTKFVSHRDSNLVEEHIPAVRSMWRLKTNSLNSGPLNHGRVPPFYLYQLFDDNNLEKDFGLSWHRKLRLSLASHQTLFVCIDDDLKQLNHPAVLQAQRRALIETFECAWPDSAEWEIKVIASS